MNNRKATKRALLTSVMALVMCVVMLLGTTFAWFTDTATANVNTIKSGNLDVVLQVKDNNGDWITSNRALTWVKNAAGSGQELLWEPGASYNLEEFRILNNGNLNLKYKVIISGATGDTMLLDVIDFSGKITDENNAVTDLTSVSMNSTTPVILDRELAAGKADTITLNGTMQTSANNTYMSKTVDNITITVVATQATGEYDSTRNDYDKFAEYPSVVTVTPNTIPSPFKANTTYFFAAGNYGDQHFVITDKENVTLIGMTGAKFDSLQISSIDYVNSNIGQEVDLDNSTLTVKGFEVTNVLDITVSDKNVVAEGNTAGSIKVKTNVSCDNIVVNNNALTGGDLGGGSVTKYGVYVVPNITDYNLTVTNNTFDNIVKHAIGVQGCGDGQAVTAANSITVKNNSFNSYGTDNDSRAAFKIWEDTNLAPSGTALLNEAAKALAAAVKTDNAFGRNLNNTCVVADFYGQTVAFN